MIKSCSYNQGEIIKNILELYVPARKIDADLTYSKGNFYNTTGIDKPAFCFDVNPQVDGVIKVDSRHAFGVTYKGENVANFGDASMFSFHATKVFHSIEGGMVSFKNPDLYQIMNDRKNFGIRGPESVVYVGGNAKMNEFSAAMGICNLRHLDDEIAKRKSAVERYRERLGNVEGITLCPIQENVETNYAYFPVVFDKDIFGLSRDEVMDNLAKEGIGARKYFYPLTNSFDCYDYDVNSTPVALDISLKVLTLPLFADLDVDTVDKICDIILG